MKNYAFFLVVVSIIIFNSCDKKESQIIDYRNFFIGQYQTSEELKSYGDPNCGEFYSLKDTIIEVGYGDTDSSIFILGRSVPINESGFYGDPQFSVRLWRDSLWARYRNGGLGCGIYETYRGNKIPD